MARPRAADYEDKRIAILRKAAQLFAHKGYDGAALAEIAAELNISKALFYHYYRSKEDLLYDIIHTHLEELVAVTERADNPAYAPKERLHRIIAAILDCYRGADDEHRIQINHLGQLSPERQGLLKGLERRLVLALSAVVQALNPALPPAHVKPLTMTLFGALNWKYMWFREGGTVSHADYIALLTDFCAKGLTNSPGGT